MNDVVHFDKYEQRGAYHWDECNRRSRNYNPPLEARYEVVVREVRGLAPVERILDVGCGDGYLIGQISDLAENIVGVDSEPQAVELANEILSDRPNSTVYQGDCYQLPFDDGSFDIVLFTDVIEHLVHAGGGLDEIRRVLRPEGLLVLTTPKWRPDRMWDDRHEKEYCHEELQQLLSQYFRSVTISYFWPNFWSSSYRTRIGWRACKYLGRHLFNPFSRESATRENSYGQIKACCRRPRVGETTSHRTETCDLEY